MRSSSSLNLKQSAKFRTDKFFNEAKHLRLASLIRSQSVIDIYLSSVQLFVNILIE